MTRQGPGSYLLPPGSYLLAPTSWLLAGARTNWRPSAHHSLGTARVKEVLKTVLAILNVA